MDREAMKRAVAETAVAWVKPGMIVGLGSGSTAAYFIRALGDRCREGLSIQTVASSRTSADLARKEGLTVLDLNAVSRVDLTIDGADEIDAQGRMIKGGGGAHVREKILSVASQKMLVIVDESKLSKKLGKAKLPVEILYYGAPVARKKIEALGYAAAWRMHEGSFFLSENGNLLLDITFPTPLSHPEKVHEELLHIPGVIDTGFFFHIADQILVAYANGKVSLYTERIPQY